MRWRRRNWVLLSLALLAGAWAIYDLLRRLNELGPTPAGNRWLLPALSLALVVMTLGLAGVLIRNLVRLIVDRRRGILGSKIRIKLVFFFLALVLLPAFVLFYGSAQVIKQTVEAIVRTPLEDLTRGGEMVDEWTRFFEGHGLRRAQALADEVERGGYLAPERRADLQTLLGERRASESFETAIVVVGSRRVAEAAEPRPTARRQELDAMIDSIVAESRETDDAVGRIGKFGEGLLAHAAVPVDGDGIVVIGSPLPTRIAGTAATLDATLRDYRQFRSQRRELVRFYVTLIGLIFIATLFVATWIGFYLARRITEPIQQVAAGAREIAAGNLDVRVDARIGDEMGMLVEAFNEMAAELQENREVITRSTADLRRSNRALDDRRRYIETLVANLSTAVISLDPAGRVSTANPAVEKILGVTLRAGQHVAEELARHGLQSIGQLADRFPADEGDDVRRDLELPDSAPTQHVSVHTSPLRSASGERLGTLLMVEDLTDLLRAQKALAWQEVARRIAHEIKNPLTPIQLAAQRLRKKFHDGAPDLDQVLLESTDSIVHEVGGLKQLVDEFSRFARMPEVHPESVDLAQLVESVLSLYRGLPSVEWEVDLDAEIGRVQIDSRQIRRALINLIDNAVAAIGGSGTIRIGGRAGARPGTLQIEVADNGPGIPPGDRDKMFAPYFSTKKRGTGLGLAIVHKVVTDHRGTIRVEDNAPHGARFVIEIPA